MSGAAYRVSKAVLDDTAGDRPIVVTIPWPADALGAYGANATGEAELDAWVAEHLDVPQGWSAGPGVPGRTRDGRPVISVTLTQPSAVRGGGYGRAARRCDAVAIRTEVVS